MGSNHSWIPSASATVALVVAVRLYVDAPETGHSDQGIRTDPGRGKSTAPERTCL
jgi:hypothetical protein